MNPQEEFAIAETFYSIQGEGMYTGVPMFFIRLAGCNVGKYAEPHTASDFQVLHPEHSTCTSFNGTSFICDTDYRKTTTLSFSALRAMALYDTNAQHICISGGEPLIHKHLPEFVHRLQKDFMIHIETSGTILLEDVCSAWISCSPKKGFRADNVPFINEFKFVVRDDADEADVKAFLAQHYITPERATVWITPIDELIKPEVVRDVEPHLQTEHNQHFAVECVKRNPGWRLNCQTHKYLGVR